MTTKTRTNSKQSYKTNKLYIHLSDELYLKGTRTSFNRNFSDIFREAIKLFQISILLKKYAAVNNISLKEIIKTAALFIYKSELKTPEIEPEATRERTVYLDDKTNAIFSTMNKKDIETAIYTQAEISERRNQLIEELQINKDEKLIAWNIANIITLTFLGMELEIGQTEN